MSEGLARIIKRLLICTSLANLLALHVWLYIFRTAQDVPIPGASFAGAIVAVFVLSVAFWMISQITDIVHLPTNIRITLQLSGLFFAWIMIIWAAVKPSFAQEIQFLMISLPRVVVGLMAILLFSVCVVLLRKNSNRIISLMLVSALLLSPFFAFNVVRATLEVADRGLSFDKAHSLHVPMLTADEHPLRTIVVLFDEFDYELAFDPAVRRDHLPVLDDLRLRGLFATRAYPPMHSTAMSIPAMLTGKLVQKSVGSNSHPGDLELQFEDGRNELWSTQESVFTDVRSHGFTSIRLNDALFPHIRIPGSADADLVVPPAPDNLLTVTDYAASHLVTIFSMLPYFRSAALDVRLGGLLGLPSQSDHVTKVVSQIVDLAGDARGNLIFMHILLPHLPVVFVPTIGNFGTSTSSDYRDNFLGVDFTVGKIIERLVERGRLNETNLIITSDHFFRQKRVDYGLGDHRIPFIALFARDSAPIGNWNNAFNTVLFRPILSGIVKGEIQNSSALARWLETHATYGESPLTEYRKGW